MLLKLFAVISFIILMLLFSSCVNAPPFDEAEWRKEVEEQRHEKLHEPHFKNGSYFNPWMPMQRGRGGDFLRWRLSIKSPYTDEEKFYKPEVIPHLVDRIKATADEDFISWIGHGTFLIRIHGEYWLTDPIFSNRALLPKRKTPPAIDADDLRELTDRVNVIISHNHYDHLDADSIRALPRNATIYVPLGLKEYVESLHSGAVNELDWWETVEPERGTKLVCLPAQHWSRRLGQGVNSTLWASYVLITPKVSIYFGGDSGYFIGYKEFGKRFPNITYALFPVTAYHPRWFMHYAHLNVEESLEAFRDLGAKYFIPTQWGAFHLGDNPPGYPALDLKRVIGEKNLDPSRFIVMDIGQVETF